jgi:hypothetical protein
LAVQAAKEIFTEKETENNAIQAVFDKVNEELRRQEDESRSKQLQQQKNEIFNSAKEDRDNFKMVADSMTARLAQIAA